MNLTFINPPVNLSELFGTEHLGCKGEQPPLGLCYLAAVLEKEGHTVRIIDAEFEDLNTEKIVSRIKKHKTDIVGLTCVTPTLDNTLEISEKIKEYDTDLLTIIGGPHISADPIATIMHDNFDIGIIGEGEKTIVELADKIARGHELKNIDGIIYKDDGKIIQANPRRLIEDLDSLPLPSRHLLPDIRKYIPYSKNYKRLPSTTMVTSRGCPYNCVFCDKHVFGSRYRQQSAERVLEEINVLVDDYGIKEIFFTEDTFTLDNKRVEKICELMKQNKIDITWNCCTRVDLVSQELLKNMKNAGCWHIYYGIESGSQTILDKLQKGITLDQIKNAIKWSDNVGIFTLAVFMINNPAETKETIEETIRFSKSIPLTEIGVLMNTPFPNTEFEKICRDYGHFEQQDKTKINLWEPVFIPKGLTREYLEKRRKEFYREFFFRPSALWRSIRQIRGWSDISRYGNRIKTIEHLFR